MDETRIYNTEEIRQAQIAETIKEVMEILESKGYDATKQIVGYLVTADPMYISSYQGAREKLTSIELSKIFEVLIKEFIK